MNFDYDLFVIGAGSGGVRAARVAAGHGAKVAIAEEYRVGGTCVIRGCVPKKLLVYGAHFAEDLQDARRFGWQVKSCKFDWPTLRDNKTREIERLNGTYRAVLESAGVEIITGFGQTLHGRVDYIAALVDPNTRAVSVRLDVPNPGEVLKRDLYVRVQLHSQVPASGILVPVSAVLRDDENLPFVFVTKPDGTFERRRVDLGSRIGDRQEIHSGLTAGESIVVEGGLFLQNEEHS